MFDNVKNAYDEFDDLASRIDVETLEEFEEKIGKMSYEELCNTFYDYFNSDPEYIWYQLDEMIDYLEYETGKDDWGEDRLNEDEKKSALKSLSELLEDKKNGVPNYTIYRAEDYEITMQDESDLVFGLGELIGFIREIEADKRYEEEELKWGVVNEDWSL